VIAMARVGLVQTVVSLDAFNVRNYGVCRLLARMRDPGFFGDRKYSFPVNI